MQLGIPEIFTMAAEDVILSRNIKTLKRC